MGEAENHISDLEHKEEKTFTQNSRKKKHSIRTAGRKMNPKNAFKCTNIRIIGVLEVEEQEQETESLFEKIMKENFPNLVKQVYIEVQEAQSPKQDGHKEPHKDTS